MKLDIGDIFMRTLFTLLAPILIPFLMWKDIKAYFRMITLGKEE